MAVKIVTQGLGSFIPPVQLVVTQGYGSAIAPPSEGGSQKTDTRIMGSHHGVVDTRKPI